MHLAWEALEEPAGSIAPKIMLEHLRDARRAARRMTDSEDAEGLHDFRVALRRLRSCLRSYRPHLKKGVPKQLRRRGKRLARGTNDSRDREVQVAWLLGQQEKLSASELPGLLGLIERVRAQQRASDKEMHATVRRFSKWARQVRKRLGHVKPTSHGGFGTVTAELSLELAAELRSQLGAIASPTDEQQAHQTRVTAKRLRYLLEPLEDSLEHAKELVVGLKELQDVLGKHHDVSVISRLIESAMESIRAALLRKAPQASQSTDLVPGLEALGRIAKQERAELFAEVRERWQGPKGESLFEKLAELARSLVRARRRGPKRARRQAIRVAGAA